MRRRTALARRRRFRRLAGGVIRCLTSPWVKIYDSGTEWCRKREAYLPLVVHVPTLNDFAWIDRRPAQRARRSEMHLVQIGIEQRPWFGRPQCRHRLGELRAIIRQRGGSRREVAAAGRRA